VYTYQHLKQINFYSSLNQIINEESTQSDENEIYDSMSSSSENSNNNMDVSFLHYEIDKDNFSEYLNKLAERELIR